MLIKDDAFFKWNAEQQEAFEILKRCISEETTLGYYNVNDRTQVIADASPVGMGAVLIQFDQNGVPRIICYANRSLTDVEKRNAQPKRKHLLCFGQSKGFVSTYSEKVFFNIFVPKSKPCARIERWVLRNSHTSIKSCTNQINLILRVHYHV